MTTDTVKRPAFGALLAADLRESAPFWLIPLGVVLVNPVVGGLIAFLAGEPTDLPGLLEATALNWSFAWAIYLFIAGVLRATNSGPQIALSGAGLKTQNALGWASDGLQALLAFVGALAATVVFRPEPPERGIEAVTLDAPLLHLPVPEALGFAFVWIAVMGAGRIIGHAFRIGSTRGGLASIGAFILAAIALAYLAGSLVRIDPSGSWIQPFLLVLCGIGVLLAPIAWALGRPGPIRAVG